MTFIYLFIKTYLYRVVHNQTILILFYSVALFLAKRKSRDNVLMAGMDVLLQIMGQTEANYPETLKIAFVINGKPNLDTFRMNYSN